MIQIHKKKLQEKHTELVNTLDFQRTHILDHLYSDGLLSAADIEEIEKLPSTLRRASHFLMNVITKKGPTAFEKFVRALVKEGLTSVAELLDPELARQFIDDVPVKRGTRSTMLKDNHLSLITSLDFDNTSIGDTLLQKGLLTPDNLEMIQNSPLINWRKARNFLLNILPRRGPNALDKFLEALQETDGQKEIFDELQRYLEPLDESYYGGIQQEFLSEEAIIKLLDDTSVQAYQPLKSVNKQEAAKLLSQGAYKMDRKVRGRAVIINNRCFMSSKDREGAQYDLEQLTVLFTNLHFEVVSYTNAYAQEIEDYIRIESEDVDHTDYDAFVLFILTHGSNGYVLGANDKPVKVDDIVKQICSCKSLHNKPKMIFIQACRPDDNEKIDLAKDICFQSETYVTPPKITYESTAGNQQLKLLSQQTRSSSDAVGSSPPANLASYKDLIIANSTIPGFLSWRSEDCGSFFVRYFVYVCSTRAHKEDLATMLNIVNGLLSRRPKKVQFEQIGESVFRGISKKVYFFPNYFV